MKRGISIIDKIIIHCSDTPSSMDIGAEKITQWHKEQGWDDIGYHYVIKKDGTIEYGRLITTVGAHCKGQNHRSIGICWIGGANGKDDRTPEQCLALVDLIRGLKKVLSNELIVYGHNEFSEKSCPNFNVSEEYGC